MIKNKLRYLLDEEKSALFTASAVSLAMIFILFGEMLSGAKADIENSVNMPELAFSQENSLISMANPTNPDPEVAWKLNVVVTAYSSTVLETDDTPNITASGRHVRDGIVANNILPFGTKIRMPELYGDKVFVVEDRMNWKKSNEHVDIWFPSYSEALNFGAKRTYIEILES